VAAQCDPIVLNVAKRYLNVLRAHGVRFESAWLFGSVVKNRFESDSDIDIAVVMQDVVEKFFKEVELMKYRREVDLRIEPHILTAGEVDSPFGREVMKSSIRIA
jgi:predicted nucleotidyltransferase